MHNISSGSSEVQQPCINPTLLDLWSWSFKGDNLSFKRHRLLSLSLYFTRMASRCIWDADTDSYAQDIFMNVSPLNLSSFSPVRVRYETREIGTYRNNNNKKR